MTNVLLYAPKVFVFSQPSFNRIKDVQQIFSTVKPDFQVLLTHSTQLLQLNGILKEVANEF